MRGPQIVGILVLGILGLTGCVEQGDPTWDGFDITDPPSRTDGDVSQATIEACTSASGWTHIRGRLANDDSDTRSYRLYVKVAHNEHILAIKQLAVDDVPPRESAGWEDTLSSGMRGATCSVLAVEQVAPP